MGYFCIEMEYRGGNMFYEWRNNPDIIARFVKSDELSGWRAHDIILKPNEALCLIQEGKIVNSYTEEKIKSAIGGIGKKLFKSSKKLDERFLFTITNPFKIEVPFELKTADQLDVNGVTTIEYQIQLDDVSRLLNLFSNNSINQQVGDGLGIALTKSGLADILFDELISRSIQNSLNELNLEEIRSSPNIQMDIASSLESDLRRTTSEYGLTFKTSYTVFSPNAFDQIQKIRGEFNLASAEKGIEHDAKLLVREREYHLIQRDIELEAACNLAKSKGEDTIGLEKSRNEILIEMEHFQSQFEMAVQTQSQELKLERERFNLEQEAADNALEREITAGNTKGQERDFQLEQQSRREELSSTQLDKSRDMKTDQMNRGQDQTTDLMKMAMQMKGADSSMVAEMMKTMMEQQTQQQNTNMQQESLQQKELLKQQTAQQFLDRASDATGDVTFVQGDHIAGTKIDTVNGMPSNQNPPNAPPVPCNICNQNTRFISQYNRHYCNGCQTYI